MPELPLGSQITTGDIKNVVGLAIGPGAKSFVLQFNFTEKVIVGREGESVAHVDTQFVPNRPPLVPPHPRSTEPELGNLIGRNAELQAFLNLVAKTINGQHGGTVWLTGQTGMGRKALARRLAKLVEEIEPASHDPRNAFTLFTLQTRFWEDDGQPDWQANEPRTKSLWEEWANYLQRTFPSASQKAGPAWISVMSQLAAMLENGELPAGLRDEPESLVTLLRHCLADCDAGVLTLEDFDLASPVWQTLIESVAREAARDLKLVLVLTARADKPLVELPAEQHSPALQLAARLAGNQLATVLWLGPLTLEDLTASFPKAEPELPKQLYELANGVPLWIEKLWADWQKHDQVERDKTDTWRRTKEFVGGNAKDYAEHLIRRLLSRPDSEFDFTADEVAELLRCAAVEGSTFTALALSEVCDFDLNDLTDFLATELGRENGLLKDVANVVIELPQTGLRRKLRRFAFEPPALYYLFSKYITEVERQRYAYALCDALERAYWPYPDRIARQLARLFELGGPLDPTVKTAPEAQARRNQRMAYYARLPQFESQLDKLRMAVIFWQTAGEDDFSQRRLILARLDFAKPLFDMSHYGECEAQAALAVQAAEAVGWREQEAYGLYVLGHVAHARGQYEQAQSYFERALAIFEQLGRQDGIADNLSNLGDVAHARGQYEQAQNYYERALALCEQLGRQSGIAVNLSNLGDVAHARGQYEQAQNYYERALALCEQLGRQSEIAINLSSLGDVAHARGQYEQAQSYFERALAIFEQLGRQDGIAVNLSSLGDVAHARGQYEQAQSYYERALALAEQLGRQSEIAINLSNLGKVAHARGQYEQAQSCYERALALFEHIKSEHWAEHVRQKLNKLKGHSDATHPAPETQ